MIGYVLGMLHSREVATNEDSSATDRTFASVDAFCPLHASAASSRAAIKVLEHTLASVMHKAEIGTGALEEALTTVKKTREMFSEAARVQAIEILKTRIQATKPDITARYFDTIEDIMATLEEQCSAAAAYIEGFKPTLEWARQLPELVITTGVVEDIDTTAKSVNIQAVFTAYILYYSLCLAVGKMIADECGQVILEANMGLVQRRCCS